MTIHTPIYLRPTLADRIADAFWQFVGSMTQDKADRITRNTLLVIAALLCVAALAI